jgi:hypothetical protein
MQGKNGYVIGSGIGSRMSGAAGTGYDSTPRRMEDEVVDEVGGGMVGAERHQHHEHLKATMREGQEYRDQKEDLGEDLENEGERADNGSTERLGIFGRAKERLSLA